MFCRWGGKEKQETKQKQNIKELQIHTESSFKTFFLFPILYFKHFYDLLFCGSEVTFIERRALQWMRCCEKFTVLLSEMKPHPFVNSTNIFNVLT